VRAGRAGRRGRLAHPQVGVAADGRVRGRAVVAGHRVGGGAGVDRGRVGQVGVVGVAGADVDGERPGLVGAGGQAAAGAGDRAGGVRAAAARRDEAGAAGEHVLERVAGVVGGAEVLDLEAVADVRAGRAGRRGRLAHPQVGVAADGRVRGRAVVAGHRVGGGAGVDRGRVGQVGVVGVAGADV